MVFVEEPCNLLRGDIHSGLQVLSPEALVCQLGQLMKDWRAEVQAEVQQN